MRRKPVVCPIPSLELLESRLLLSAWSDAASLAGPALLASPPPVLATWATDAGAKGFGAPRASFGDEAGSMRSTALSITLSSAGAATISARIDYNGDLDYFTFLATVTGPMQVTFTPAAGSAVDGKLAAYDAYGWQLASNSPSAVKSASVSFNVVAGKRYYVLASSAGGKTGAYALGVTTTGPTPTPPPPPPDPTPVPPPDPTPVPPPAPGTLWPSATNYTPGASISTQTRTVSGQTVLVVLGTDSSDVITISQTAGGITVMSGAGSQTVAGTFVGVALYGFGGADVLRLVNSVSITTLTYAGGGSDQVFDAALGSGTIYGQDGDDLLVSVGSGADKVYGGTGLDGLWLDSSDTAADTEAAETAAKSVHRITSFYQPTSDAASRPSLEIAGQNLVDPAASYGYQNYANMPLFADGPQYNDIRQGSVGDCYFLASLASLADSDPGRLRQMIAPMGDGTFAVRFFRNGQETYLRVDADLPGSGSWLAYAKLTPANELWVAVTEKAYAQFRTGQNSYASISGGWMTAVYQEVTGASASAVYTTSVTATSLANTIQQNLAAGHAVTAGSYTSSPAPIYGSHAYEVKSIENVGGQWFVTVYNPWGYDGQSWDSNSSDGLLRLSMDQFRQCFTATCISLA